MKLQEVKAVQRKLRLMSRRYPAHKGFYPNSINALIGALIEKIRQEGIDGCQCLIVCDWSFSEPGAYLNFWGPPGEEDDPTYWEEVGYPEKLSVRRVEPGEMVERPFDGSNNRHFIYGWRLFIAPKGYEFDLYSWDNTDKGKNTPETSGYGRGEEGYKVVKRQP